MLEKQRALEAERVAQLQAETAAMEAEASAIMEGTENPERADSPSPSERLKLVPSTLQPEPEPVLPPSPPPSSPSSLPPSPPPPLPHLLTSSPPRQRYGNEGSRTLSIATGFLPTSTGCSYEPAGSAGSVLSGRARQEYDAIRARTIDRSPRSPVAYASAPYFGLRSSERTVLSSPSPRARVVSPGHRSYLSRPLDVRSSSSSPLSPTRIRLAPTPLVPTIIRPTNATLLQRRDGASSVTSRESAMSTIDGAFDVLDSNGDGQISREEWRAGSGMSNRLVQPPLVSPRMHLPLT